MKFDIITIFPDIFNSYLDESILKRAQKNKLIDVEIHNLRDFTEDKHCKVDDRPFGGGPGMVLKIEPIIKAVNKLISYKLKSLKNKKLTNLQTYKLKTKIIIFTPGGKQFDNKIAAQMARNYDQLILICGRYEGIDARLISVLKTFPPEAGQPSAEKLKVIELSIGPYVLTGGELPSMILIDAVSRQISGVLGKEESLEEKRFGAGLPTYTRPEIFIYKKRKYVVPKVLLSGNHKKIEEWRRKNK